MHLKGPPSCRRLLPSLCSPFEVTGGVGWGTVGQQCRALCTTHFGDVHCVSVCVSLRAALGQYSCELLPLVYEGLVKGRPLSQDKGRPSFDCLVVW